MVASALGSACKPAYFTALFASTQDNDKYEDEGEYEYEDEDEEKPTDSNDEANNAETEEFEKTGDSKGKYVNLICLLCQNKGLLDSHRIQYFGFIKPSIKSELQFGTMCLYLKTYGTMHYCKDFYRRNKFVL